MYGEVDWILIFRNYHKSLEKTSLFKNSDSFKTIQYNSWKSLLFSKINNVSTNLSDQQYQQEFASLEFGKYCNCDIFPEKKM